MNEEDRTMTNQIREALDGIKALLGCTSPETWAHASVHALTLTEALRLPLTDHHLHKNGRCVVYIRAASGFDPYFVLQCAVDITADNYTELPTEALRLEARKLLGLPEPTPQYTTGVVELGVQG